MPRSMWNGAIAFGSVVVPVKVFAATEPQPMGMRELHLRDGAPIAHRRFDSVDGEPVDKEDLARGVEVRAGEWVVLSREELQAVDAPRRRAIEIEAFVRSDQVDPVHFDRAYNLAPQDAGVEGYGVLLAALREAGRTGIGRVVLRSRERLVALLAAGSALRMHTMRFHDELVPGERIQIGSAARKPSKAEMEMADTLMDALAGEFEPSRLQDTYRERVVALARSKARGEAPPPQPRREPEPEPEESLLEALKASVAAVS